jgi:hypothetical protein
MIETMCIAMIVAGQSLAVVFLLLLAHDRGCRMGYQMGRREDITAGKNPRQNGVAPELAMREQHEKDMTGQTQTDDDDDEDEEDWT